MTTYAIVGHHERKKYRVRDLKTQNEYILHSDEIQTAGYSAPNQDPFIWYKNWMYSFCHAHNFINKFYDEESNNGLKDKETYFIFVTPEDKKREKFIIDTVIKAKQIIKIDRERYRGIKDEDNKKLIKDENEGRYAVKISCKELAKEINDKVNNDFNISKSDIENVILKHHYPAFLCKNGSNYKNCDKECPLKEMYMGSVHNTKGSGDLYSVIGDPEESFIPLIKDKETGKFKNFTIDSNILKNIGLIPGMYARKISNEECIKELIENHITDDCKPDEVLKNIEEKKDELFKSAYRKTTNEFIADVFGDKNYFSNLDKYEDYKEKIKNIKEREIE